MVGEHLGERRGGEHESVGRVGVLQHRLRTLEEGDFQLGRGLDEHLQRAARLLSLVRDGAAIELLAERLERGQIAGVHDGGPGAPRPTR